jgi:uncharacterized protein YndB with AHSA1/START domain
MSDSTDVVTVERVIPAPAEAIFDLLADPARHRDIDGSGTVQGAKGETGRLGLGRSFGMSMRLGIPYSMVSTVVEFDENRRIAWQTRGPTALGRRVGGRIWRYELEPAGAGTSVRESWDISQEKGPVKYVLRTGRAKDHTRKAMERTLENIASLVEQ